MVDSSQEGIVGVRPIESHLPLIESLMPDDWYVQLFDERYYLIDCIRKSLTKTKGEVEGILRLSGMKPPGPVLDLACGYGRHSILLAERNFTVHGMDLSRSLLSISKKNAKKAGVQLRFEEGDLKLWDYPNSQYRLVLLLDTTFGYFPQDRENFSIICGAFKALTPGGIFILEQINPASPLSKRRMDEEIFLQNSFKFRKYSSFLEPSRLWLGYYEYTNSISKTCLPFKIRIYNVQSLIEMLGTAGFYKNDILVFGDWSGGRFVADESPFTIVLACKKC
jgi:D-alanine-D-alanine ligase